MSSADYRPIRSGRIALSSMAELLACRMDVAQPTKATYIALYVGGRLGKGHYSVRVVPDGQIVPTGKQSEIRRPATGQPVVQADPEWTYDLGLLGDQTDSVGASTAAGAYTSAKLVLKLRNSSDWLTDPSALQRYAATLRVHVRARANITSGAWIRPIVRINGADYSLGTTYLGPEWIDIGGADGIDVSYNPAGPSRWSIGDWRRMFYDSPNQYGIGLEASPFVEVAEISVELVWASETSIGTRRYGWTPDQDEAQWIPYDADLAPGTYWVLLEPVVVDNLNYLWLPHVEDQTIQTAAIWRRDQDALPAVEIRRTGWVQAAILGDPCVGQPYYDLVWADEGAWIREAGGTADSIAVWAQPGQNPSYSLTGPGTRSGPLDGGGANVLSASFVSLQLTSPASTQWSGLTPALLRGAPDYHVWPFERALPTTTVANDWSVVGASTVHEAVDDPIGQPDEDWSLVQATAAGQKCLLQVDSTAFSSVSAPIQAVAVVARIGSAQSNTVRAVMRAGSSDYTHPTIVAAKTGWDTITWIWYTRPEDGQSWTLADIQAFHSGGTRAFGLEALQDGVLATQCYLLVEYGTEDRWLELLGDQTYVDNSRAPYDDYVAILGQAGGISGLTVSVDRLLGRATLSWTYTGSPQGAIVYRDGEEIGRTDGTTFIDYEPPIGPTTYRVRAYYGMLLGGSESQQVDLGGIRHAVCGSNVAATSCPLAVWPHEVSVEVGPAASYRAGAWTVATLPRSGRKVELRGQVMTEYLPRDQAIAAIEAMAGQICHLRVPGVWTGYVVLGDVQWTADSPRTELEISADGWEVTGPQSVTR